MDTMFLQPDEMIGAYRVIRRLGQGGMGAVYEVEHYQLGVHYALKCFTLDGENAAFFGSRFVDEGRILARLNHPNLVRVIDLAWDEERQITYYVMDLFLYKDGEARTLNDIEAGGADEDWIYEWFKELCGALAYVHAHGVVHRDIKLSNILLAADKHVVLSDFGVSRICDEDLRASVGSDHTSSFVSSGMAVGTRGYMAPEILLGAPATPASDVYSLGVAFFKLLTDVWYDSCLAAGDLGASQADAAKLLEGFERPWKEVLLEMLSFVPTHRPTDLAHLPERLVSTKAVTRIRRLKTRPRTWWTAAAAGGVLLAGGVAWWLLRGDGPSASDDAELMSDAFSVPTVLQ